MSESKEQVAVTVLWSGTDLIMEERWIDQPDGTENTVYAFPSGKREPGESIQQAAARKALEKTGVAINPSMLPRKPDVIETEERDFYVFNAPLSPVDTSKLIGSVVIWSIDDLMRHKQRGKLMRLTDKYVEDHF